MFGGKKILAIIPARGGSKGVPRKNIKFLCGKPLICYTIDAVKPFESYIDICISTDDREIKDVVEQYGVRVPFMRPKYLATDSASTVDVLLHALQFYRENGKYYDILLVLQPTSPFRQSRHIEDALTLFRDDIDMVVSVKTSHAAVAICRENIQGYLELPLNEKATRRQDLTDYYEYNGAIYVVNVESLLKERCLTFDKKIKYLMDDLSSVDIDNNLDFEYAEFLMRNNK
ncbi:MAG: acylneuraminate cytidylyltransferase family protein [Bacteroidales bacterium]|nr:acylneuraminate cytidylyltransferase family protein [Bacteroidales bacterium]